MPFTDTEYLGLVARLRDAQIAQIGARLNAKMQEEVEIMQNGPVAVVAVVIWILLF
jgi:hypothetical protein